MNTAMNRDNLCNMTEESRRWRDSDIECANSGWRVAT